MATEVMKKTRIMEVFKFLQHYPFMSEVLVYSRPLLFYRLRYAMRSIVLAGFLFLALSGFSQTSIDSIDLKRIPQRKIRNLLVHERNSQIRYLTDFRPSCENDQDTTGFSVMENTYLIKEKPEDVWNIYKTTSLVQAWSGKMISFGLLFSKWSDQILYCNDAAFACIDTGQVFFIDLRLLHGLFNLPVGVQVLKIDSLLQSITFSYLEGGKSSGIQTIRLFADGNGFTKIIHTSAFKSNSRFRDKHLYPFYHTKVLNEFHWNILGSHLNSPDEFVISP
jgi:hypothetical protein